MSNPSSDINSNRSFGTSLEQFRSALTRHVARRNMGLELSEERAESIAADSALSASWYKLWRISASQSSARAVRIDDPLPGRAPGVARGETALEQELIRPPEHSRESNRIPPAAVLPHEELDMTFEQFRTALRRSAGGRRHIGLDIPDDDAAAIANDAELSAAWFRRWRIGGRASPVPDDAPAAEPSPSGHADGLIGDWQRHLPVRFNPPPGWPDPSPDWILQHIGLEMSDHWRPPGAPTDDPPGWMWWIPQEPAWTAWINSRNGAAQKMRTAGTVFGVFLGLALTLSLAGWTLWLVLASVCAFGSGVGLLLTIASDRHFRKDPLGELRDNRLQVAERLKIGAPVGDGHHIYMADFSDIGSWFDGE